jgi:hypothetical protein
VADDIEVIKSVNELINAQADQLWTISIAVIVAEVFMIAHLSSRSTLTIRERYVRGALCLAVVFHAFSLACGYFSKGALIQAMITLAIGHEWTFPWQAATFNFIQVVAVTVGLVIFVVCFFFYSKELARAMKASKA